MSADSSEGAPPSPSGGERRASDLAPLVYDELRQLAAKHLAERDWTIQPTALVHEAYIRCSRQDRFRSSDHFAAVAAKAMRQILVDHARRRRAGKRDRRRRQECEVAELTTQPVDVLELDEALRDLAELDARKAEVVEMRVFGQLTIEATARELGVSHMTVSSDWRFARAWLADRLCG
ncbi:MAG: ECF-type sigma factor [Planctomycetota bacterium]